jgi:hypothetical protein
MKKALLLLGFTFFALGIKAQWSSNPALNNEVAVQSGWKEIPSMCSDGSGGAIIAWLDWNLGDLGVYVQRINSNGNILWQVNGIGISAIHSVDPMLVSDGTGGAIIVWKTGTINNEDIFAQRINGAGVVQWAANGVTLCNATNTQYHKSIIADGAGGAIVTWSDDRAALSDPELYAQKINANGIIQWAVNGVKVSTTMEFYETPRLVSDGAGGAIIAWVSPNYKIYCQRVTSNGMAQWTANGVLLSNVQGNFSEVDITTDGSGGAILCWEGTGVVDIEDDIFARRILSNGTPQWAANGVLVSDALLYQNHPRIIAAGSGSAIVTWQDANGAYSDIYAQKISSAGVNEWTYNGIVVCSNQSWKGWPIITTDGNGGAIIAWDDRRNVALEIDLYAQRISGAGVRQWNSDGVAVCTATDNQEDYIIIADGNGGAILTWEDHRAGGSNPKIYAQRITSYGALPIANDGIETTNEINVFPNPSQGLINIKSKYYHLYIAVRNMLGQTVFSELLTDFDNKINLEHLPIGIYRMDFVSADDSKQLPVTKTIVLER